MCGICGFNWKDEKLLNEMLNSAKVGRSDCYITNVIKDLDRPAPHYIQLYKGKSLLKTPIISKLGQDYIDYLKWELSQLSAKYIIAFGGIALFALTGMIGIGRWRGSRLDCILDPQKQVIPTYHPATVLPPKNQHTNRFLIIHDIKKATEANAGLYVPTDRAIFVKPTFIEAVNFLIFARDQGLNGERIGYDLEVFMNRKHKEVSCISLSVKTQSMSIPFAIGYEDYFSLKQEVEIWQRIASILKNMKLKDQCILW